MDKKLQAELRKLDRQGFRELELSIQIARNVRILMANYDLTDEWVMERLQISKKVLADYRIGAYPFKVTDIAGIDAMSAELEMDDMRKKKKSMITLTHDGSGHGEA